MNLISPVNFDCGVFRLFPKWPEILIHTSEKYQLPFEPFPFLKQPKSLQLFPSYCQLFWQGAFVLFYVYKRWNRYLGEWMYGLRCSIQNWEVPGFNPHYVLGQPCYKFFSGAFLYTFGNSVFGHFFQYERDWLIVACPNISIYPSIFLSIYL